MTDHPPDFGYRAPATVPRRWVLRALTGAVLGGALLTGLSGCGGEDDDDDEDDDERTLLR
jgi:hypothetical protein